MNVGRAGLRDRIGYLTMHQESSMGELKNWANGGNAPIPSDSEKRNGRVWRVNAKQLKLARCALIWIIRAGKLKRRMYTFHTVGNVGGSCLFKNHLVKILIRRRFLKRPHSKSGPKIWRDIANLNKHIDNIIVIGGNGGNDCGTGDKTNEVAPGNTQITRRQDTGN